MKFDELIKIRLDEMSRAEGPTGSPWPEGCQGSRRALVIFLGPSPGGKTEDHRSEREFNKEMPLWNEPLWDPVREWSNGFRNSFQPIVETIFGTEYQQAGKLVAVLNLDWMGNTQSKNVPVLSMREGGMHILPIIEESEPSLIIPMDRKAHDVFQNELLREGFDLDPVLTNEVLIRINSNKYHRELIAFKANKGNAKFLVIKSFQHPARILDYAYALRIGKALRMAADQVWEGKPVSLRIE
jgi:hypothetical protein